MNETPVWLREVYGILQPIITMLVTTVGPILVTYVGAKFVQFLNVKGEKEKAELEKALRDAIHASAQNAWLFALKRAGLSFSDISELADDKLLATLQSAKNYVKDKNPEGLEKLGVNDQQLEDILVAKLPSSVRNN